jgi:hypothetical protein
LRRHNDWIPVPVQARDKLYFACVTKGGRDSTLFENFHAQGRRNAAVEVAELISEL